MTGFRWTKTTIILVCVAMVIPLVVAVPILAGTFGPVPSNGSDIPVEVDVAQEQTAPAEAPDETAAAAAPPSAPQPAPPPPELAAAQPAAQTAAAPAPPPGPVQNANIADVENRLVELSYLVGDVDGVMDGALKHGITAFQKVEGLPRTGELDVATLARLDTASRPTPMFSQPPNHFEVDLPRQVVFVVSNGEVLATLPTSTGNNELFTSQGYTRRAVTPNGKYEIDFKRQGWRYAPLGALYRPSYFNGGIAFHGSKSVPTSPASHGCVRLPMQFADWFADRATIGSTVYVYGGPSGENPQPELDPDPPAQQQAAPVAQAPPEPGNQGNNLLGDLLGGG